MADTQARPFSLPWTILSIALFMAVELFIGTWVGPLVIGKYVSPMFHYELQMAMHLVSFYLGGLAVGVVSPGRRLTEPAVGAFVSVLLVFLMAVFMPNWFLVFSVPKVLAGGTIALLLALAGAWQGESFMGNLPDEGEALKESKRGQLRSLFWTTDDAASPQRRERLRD